MQTYTIIPDLAVAHESAPVTISPDLLKRARAGDNAAFLCLYMEHAGHVYAVCLRMLANTARAKELAQETLVRAWQTLGSFSGDHPFGAWVHRIAVNAVLDHLRTERRRSQRVEFTDEVERFEEDRPGNPIETIDLECAIASLPVQARAVLVLHDIEGYRHEEIASLLGIAPGTSKAQLHRARMLVRERLQQ